MSRKTLIIAGNFSEFLHYVRASNLKTTDCIYVYEMQQLMKYRDVNVIFIGQYWLNPVAKQAEFCKPMLEDIPRYKRLPRAIVAKSKAILKRIVKKCSQNS